MIAILMIRYFYLILATLFLVFSASAYAALLLPIPFTSQAPFGDWVEPYQNFCEEASIVMVAHYLRGYPINTGIADLEMRIIKTYEDLVFKRNKDTSADEIAQTLRVLYGFRDVEVKEVMRPRDIADELGRGRAVIVPVAGRMLGNPYFTPPGPLYHTVVIKGYDAERKEFIINDPGTRRGEGMRYREEILFEALHDWNRGDVLRGKKVMVSAGR